MQLYYYTLLLQFIILLNYKIDAYSTAYKVDLVISLCKETFSELLQFLLKQSNVNYIFIYSKCGQTASFVHNNKVIFRTLNNIGREGHSYLHHILYNNISTESDYTSFLQADGGNHFFPGLNTSDYINYLNTKDTVFAPISAQIIFVKENQLSFHRYRDGFQSLHPCHSGVLNNKFDWKAINRERIDSLNGIAGFWGNESTIDSVKLKLKCGAKDLLSFSSPGNWPCNFFPLEFKWLKKDKDSSVIESIYETWTLIFGNLKKMPKVLYYVAGAQFTFPNNLSKKILSNNNIYKLYEKLSLNDNPIEGYHLEILWGYILNFPFLKLKQKPILQPFSDCR